MPTTTPLPFSTPAPEKPWKRSPRPFPPPPLPGSTPNSLALSPGRNPLVRGQCLQQQRGRVRRQHAWAKAVRSGFIPVGWYPTSVRVTPDGRHLLVANGKGLTSEANPRGPQPNARRSESTDPTHQQTVFQARSASFRCPRGAALTRQLAVYTAQAYQMHPATQCKPRVSPRPGQSHSRPRSATRARSNMHLHHQGKPHLRPGARRPAPRQRRPEPLPFPRAGHAQPSPARPRVRPARQLLCRWRGQRRRPRMVHGRLRHRFRGENLAADLRPHRARRSLSLPRAFPIASPANGYLWDRAKEAGVSYRSYGEFVFFSHHSRPDPALRGCRRSRTTSILITAASTWTTRT